MSARTCIRGCTMRGEHYAQCPDYARNDGACLGCAPVEALEGAMICRRCCNRLRQKLEQAPEIIEHIRIRTQTVSVMRYDRLRGNGDPSAHAPIPPEMLDAQRDIMATICAGALAADASPGRRRCRRLAESGTCSTTSRTS